ncbi:ATP-binding protein [Bifidobacterium scaligerum]|uniref:AAA family ATPase n=1 Tax=Bifidobacterium scaligerum TaxID=2052656 RepID=A0A2M9HNS1_9BIFI|nr:ATP-binding protein [Bifidobacterium scaligerum]PJM78429.1 AAA family ATPase [Bifidobacterium scaligerum]
MVFIGREHDLQQLDECYHSRKSQLVFVYGRRRVGKTETLTHFSRGKETLFFAAQNATREEQLASFSRLMFEAGAPGKDYLRQYPTWESALTELSKLPEPSNGERRLVVFDEFPYLVKADPSLPSILQNLWDHTLRNANIMIIICGSSMSFIEKELLAEKSPLYGRATGILKMNPMPYWDAVKFFPDYSNEEKALAYAILGGIPRYLEEFDPDEPVDVNIKKHILRRIAPLYSEVEFLLHEELRETARYNSVIRAIALGDTSLNEIATHAMLSNGTVSSYLSSLMELGIVEREFPVTAKLKEQAKGTRGLYQLSDNFFRFWYSFVFPYRSELEHGDAISVYERRIAPVLHDFAGKPFEEICREWLWRESIADRLPFHAARIGRWWNRTDEIDVMAVDDSGGHAIAGECKFRNTPMDMGMLNLLRRRAANIGVDDTNCYLFSLSGFDSALADITDPTVRLIGIDELFQ